MDVHDGSEYVFTMSQNMQSWDTWFNNQIKQHPEIIAAREKMNSAFSMAEGKSNPLYNQELETEFEQEGDEGNYRVGMSQTIDWWDKRDTRKQQASFNRFAARKTYELTLQRKIVELLQTLIEWQAANKQSALALQQEVQMEILIALITKRQNAGDLAQLDAELAFLSFSQKLNTTAQTQVRLRQIEARLRELLPGWAQKN